MTDTIIKAHEEQQEKFIDISERTKEINELRKNRTELTKKIIKIYNSAFRNLTPHKRDVGLNFTNNRGYGEGLIHFTKEGITLKQPYKINTTNIASLGFNEFIKVLMFLKGNTEIVNQNLVIEKQINFKNFVEKIELLKQPTQIELEFNPKTIKLYKKHEDNIEVSKMFANFSNNTIFINENNGFKGNSIKIDYPDLEDEILIEQLYEELKAILEKARIYHKELYDNTLLYVNDITTKFQSFLILDELKKSK